MRKYTEKKKIVREVNQISCNSCGKSDILSDKEETSDFMRNAFIESHYHEYKTSFTYGSKYDNETWQFDLCENCLEKITESFLIPPVKKKGDIF